jgi:DnaK suppressor protein
MAKKKPAAHKKSAVKKGASAPKKSPKKAKALKAAPAKKKPAKKAAAPSRQSKTGGKRMAEKASAGAKKAGAPRKLTAAQIEHFKKKLLVEKQRVLEEMGEMQSTNLKQSIADQSGEISHYSYHLGDTASLSYDREFSMGLAERQQKYLEQIDDALARMEEGTYGICKVTGEPIPVERLEEVPVAKYSVKGKEIIERQRRAMGVPMQSQPQPQSVFQLSEDN